MLITLGCGVVPRLNLGTEVVSPPSHLTDSLQEGDDLTEEGDDFFTDSNVS